MKSDHQTPLIFDGHRLTLSPRLRRCTSVTMEVEDFMKSILGNPHLSKPDLAQIQLEIPLSLESKPLDTITTPGGLFQFNFSPLDLHISSGIFYSPTNEAVQGSERLQAYQENVITSRRPTEERDSRFNPYPVGCSSVVFPSKPPSASSVSPSWNSLASGLMRPVTNQIPSI